ncbi:MAG TPA: hypothetical protein VJX68_04700 [Candidatus Binatus sp.]|uniref:hypothetical protein n=1 Tax=Candidatus Binatus sp. TaxID=2811406 RepID=UPI002B464F97|nr:hypothetical protein [Candidatus Binatus sp.]HKN12476.1 hypothetical protein [Candidatus Binatus sp.]
MAGSKRHFTVAAVAIPFLFLAMSGLARAIPVNFINVDTLNGDHVAGHCSLPDAVKAANGLPVAGATCATGTGNDEIDFLVTGVIAVDVADLPLSISDTHLSIVGPGIGCSGVGPCGITISGGNSLTGGIFLWWDIPGWVGHHTHLEEPDARGWTGSLWRRHIRRRHRFGD